METSVFAHPLIDHSNWHTFEATFAGSLPYSSTTHRCMLWKAPGKQSQMQQCQLLRQTTTVWRNPGTWCYDVLPSADVYFAFRTRSRQMPAVLLLFRPLQNVGIQNFGMWGMYDLSKAYRSKEKSIANRKVDDWEASNGHTEDTTQLFDGPWHVPVGEHICA